MTELLADDVDLGDAVKVEAALTLDAEAAAPDVVLAAIKGATTVDVDIEPSDELTLMALPADAVGYVSTWVPPEAGRWLLRLTVSGTATAIQWGAVVVRPSPV